MKNVCNFVNLFKIPCPILQLSNLMDMMQCKWSNQILNIILYHSFFTLNLLYFTKRYALVSAMGYFFNTVWLWTYSSTKNKGNTKTPNIALFFKIFTTQKLLSSNINQVFTFKIFPNICRSENHASKQIPPAYTYIHKQK